QQMAAARRADVVRVDSIRNGTPVRVCNQARADLGDKPVPKGNHFGVFVARVDMHQREGNPVREECFPGEMQHYRRVFTYRIQQDRPLELGRRLSQNVDGLGFQYAQVREAAYAPYRGGRWCGWQFKTYGTVHMRSPPPA